MFSIRSTLAYAAATLVVVYCLSVLYYVHTAWDLGIRGLFSACQPRAAQLPGMTAAWAEDAVAADGTPPRPGDVVLRGAGVSGASAIHLPHLVAEAAGPASPPVAVATDVRDLSTLPADAYLADVDGNRWVRVDYAAGVDGTPRSAWLQLRPTSLNTVGLSTAWFLLEMIIFTIGAVVVWKRPSAVSAVLFFTLCTVNVVTFMGAFHWPTLLGSKWLVYPFVFCAMLVAPTTLHFFALFPRPLGVMRARPRLSTTLLYVVPAVWTLFLFYQIHAIDRLYFETDAADQITRMLAQLAGTIYGYLAASVAMYLVGFGVLIYRIWRGRTAQERQQVQGLLSAVMLTTGPVGYLLYTALEDRAQFAFGPMPKLMMYLTSLIFTTAYGLSITRYKLLQVGRFVNQGLLYVGISSVATVLFCALVGLSTALIGQFYFRWENALMAGLTSMTIVIFLSLIRDRFQKSLDRSFYREKYRLDKAVRQLGAAVDRLVEPAQLARQLLQGARSTVGAVCGAVYLRSPGDEEYALADQVSWPDAPLRIARAHPLMRELSLSGTLKSSVGGAGAKALQTYGAELGFLLELEGAIVGAAFFGPRTDGDPYTPEDQNFLTALTRTTALALSTAQGHRTILSLKEELQEKVDKIADQQRRIMYLQGELLTRSDAESRPDEPAGAAAAPPTNEVWRSEILGAGPAVQELLQKAAKVAQSSASVLVRGDSGTGKELLARAIHANGPRSAKPFVSVHCAALSSSLLESELFGHVRGAFTGADRDKIGRFELADGGTLFLDEIGDINLETQTKLLRVLQERTFERVGGTQTIAVDVRLIAATHQNLEEFIRQGRFREDLFYRLNVISLRCPPLRDRREDIFELALHFLRSSAKQSGRSPTRIDEDALEALMNCAWPGNIRQLENAVARAVVLSGGDAIRREDLPPEILTAARAEGTARPRPAARREVAPVVHAGRVTVVETAPPPAAVGLTDQLDHWERERLSEALVRSGGNKAEAARALGIPRSTLFSKLRKYGLE